MSGRANITSLTGLQVPSLGERNHLGPNYLDCLFRRRIAAGAAAPGRPDNLGPSQPEPLAGFEPSTYFYDTRTVIYLFINIISESCSEFISIHH